MSRKGEGSVLSGVSETTPASRSPPPRAPHLDARPQPLEAGRCDDERARQLLARRQPPVGEHLHLGGAQRDLDLHLVERRLLLALELKHVLQQRGAGAGVPVAV